jgi:hypothetical protein
MLVNVIRDVHFGQRGRSIGVSRDGEDFDITLPYRGGSVTDSRSPMVAEGGAMIEPRCASGFRTQWSILLTFPKIYWTQCRTAGLA